MEVRGKSPSFSSCCGGDSYRQCTVSTLEVVQTLIVDRNTPFAI